MPDAAFLDYFAKDFQRALDKAEIPGMSDASWDRKAAWLLWNAKGCPAATGQEPRRRKTTTTIIVEEDDWRTLI